MIFSSDDRMTKQIFFRRTSVLFVLFFGLLIATQPDSYALEAKRFAGGLSEEETISMERLRAKLARKEKLIVMDARAKKSYDEGHVQGAILPMTADYYRSEELFRQGAIRDLPDPEKDLADATRRYPRDIPIVTYCSDHCQASTVLLFRLKKLKLSNVKAMNGGFQSWQKKGYPWERST